LGSQLDDRFDGELDALGSTPSEPDLEWLRRATVQRLFRALSTGGECDLSLPSWAPKETAMLFAAVEEWRLARMTGEPPATIMRAQSGKAPFNTSAAEWLVHFRRGA
jgi:hypothetical protein